jgi:ATP-binding cassette subfamily B protein
VPVALLVSTGPALYVVIRYVARIHEWTMKNTSRRRRAFYYDWLVTYREAAAELRLFGLGRHFSELYQKTRARLRHEQLDLARAEAGAEIFAGLFALALAAAALGFMVFRTVQGALTLGGLAMFYQAFIQGQKLLRTLLETVGQLYSNILFLENLFEFLELEPEITSPPSPQPAVREVNRGIVFRGVSFSYPSSEAPVLHDFNLEIAAGSVVAMLGSNGAGKSTLFKLLCRLYDPDTGCLEIDDRDLRSFDLAELRRMITVLFQEPVHYAETMRHNVELGDLANPDRSDRVAPAIEAAGAGHVVERLPKGVDHLLGTWFEGGAEISTGEWQRVALSRAFLRDAPIVLLDEPTSAMDSWAEADWMHRFRRFAEGRTAVVITHRLSTAMIADIIHVMDRGRIIESGSHRQLLAAGGRYAQAWNAHGLGTG